MNRVSQSVGSVIDQATSSPYFIPVMALIVLVIGYRIIYYKPNFPCFCDKCETKLIDAALSGDPVAQAKLQQAMYNNAMPDYLGRFGPLGWIVLLALIVGGAYVVSAVNKRASGAFPGVFPNP